MKKGITPIISIIILLLITVALAGVAWTYLSGWLSLQTEKSFIIPAGGTWCDGGGEFHVRVLNTGTSAIQAGEWTATVEGRFGTPPTFGTKPITVAQVDKKGSATFATATADGLSGESYTIRVAAGSVVQSQATTCS